MSIWKKGRGKLGIFEALIGSWICNKGSKDRQNPQCTRTFRYDLANTYIIQDVRWFLGDKNYDDHTLIGLNSEKTICFWSFTSDGKNATGTLADVSDIHPEAIGFVAEMPAGTARQAFWPNDDGTFNWIVESKTKKGWNRFVHQVYSKED